jgi:hypothetical protein
MLELNYLICNESGFCNIREKFPLYLPSNGSIRRTVLTSNSALVNSVSDLSQSNLIELILIHSSVIIFHGVLPKILSSRSFRMLDASQPHASTSLHFCLPHIPPRVPTITFAVIGR